MLLPPPNRLRAVRPALVSLAAHAIILLLITGAALYRPLRVVTLPGTASGTHIDLIYLPGSTPAPALKAEVKPHQVVPAAAAAAMQPAPSLLPANALPIPLPPRPHLTVTTPDSDHASSSPAPADAAAGSDSFGSGNVQIAFTTYSPSPVPDLSLLPTGSQGDVVLDVTIDTSGKVAQVALVKTLGYGIESRVIQTVRTWTFRPATKDGIPIASIQELHFHYGPV
ncbi:MAG TPA: energy transducer TonB [Acidobacteriaceae bacterium]|jgi:protein TonB|nr:energy transducer TonB [Acidobacteriaceae bacterium]